MSKTRFLLAAATVAVSLTGGLVATSRNDTASAAAGTASAAAAITWQDEFNLPSGSAVDGSKWAFDTGEPGIDNDERQWYTNSTRNTYHDGQGHLVIKAIKENPGIQCHYGPCQYTSGRIKTQGKFAQQYGRFEASIKIPKGQAIWPAFWMLGNDIGNVGWPNSGEIDIMENIGREPNTVHGTVHGPGYSGAGGIGNARSIGSPLGDAFHTYAVDWSPNLIVWYLDGSEFFRLTPSNINGNRWVFDHQFFMILNLAIGGLWPGYPDGSTPAISEMLVDYVRVSAWDGGTTPPPSGGNGLKSNFSNRCIDIPGGNASDGVRLQMYDCNNSSAQQWTFNSDGTLRGLGVCMDPAGGALTNGTPIQIVRCNGNPVQRFTLSGAGDLVNISANKCVDIKDWNSNNGAQLILYDCTGGSNQKWARA